MMGNFWLLNRRRRWAAVCISKCGCSTLKYHALADDAGLDPATLSHNELHDRVGYAANHFLAPITADPPDGYVRFAVWRDPVDRFLSVMRNFGAGGHARRNFAGLADLDTAAWIDFTLAELRKPTLRQDEHLRRQADYFDAGQLDALVELSSLTRWLGARFGHAPIVRNRSATRTIALRESQRRALRELYAKDEALPARARDLGVPFVETASVIEPG